MTDPTAHIAFLRQQRDAAADPAVRAMFDTLIAQLEPQPSQHVTNSQVGAAIAGDVFDTVDVTVIFQQAGVDLAAEQRELLDAYLTRLADRCDRLRVAGAVRRESGRDRRSTMTLSQVYVTLASTAWVTLRGGKDSRQMGQSNGERSSSCTRGYHSSSPIGVPQSSRTIEHEVSWTGMITCSSS